MADLTLKERIWDASLIVEKVIDLDLQTASDGLPEVLDDDLLGFDEQLTEILAGLWETTSDKVIEWSKEDGGWGEMPWYRLTDPGWVVCVTVPTYKPHPDGKGAQVLMGWRHCSTLHAPTYDEVIEKALAWADEMREKDWPTVAAGATEVPQ